MATPRVNRPHLKTGRKEKPLAVTLEQIEVLAGLGLTEDDIALVNGVHRTTLAKRKLKDINLAEAIRRGKLRADTEVIKSLYTRATVYGDTTAMIFWLKNRRPDQWRDKQDVDLKGAVTLIVSDEFLPRKYEGTE